MSYRENILRCLGEFPGRTDLNPEIISSLDKGTHIIQQVSYCVEENERIIAYLLIPKPLNAKNPAVIASHQHAAEYFLGKSEPAGLSRNSMYHYGLELCLRGYVVLCPDHLGFEERRPPEFIRTENSNLDGMNYERFLFTKYYLEGRTLQAKYISDLCRGIDFLESLGFVNRDKIGAIGHSLGGQETLWLAWYDSRIKAGVSSCGFSQLHSILRDGINHNYAMYIHGFLKTGDLGDLVCDMAPKPFMSISAIDDPIFPIDGVDEIGRAAARAYYQGGAAENISFISIKGRHAFPPEAKKAAYEWLDRFLKQEPVKESKL